MSEAAEALLGDPDLVLKFGLSLAIATAMAAGVLVGVLEWGWLKRARRLSGSARRAMVLSLSPLPPNAMIATALAPVWFALYVSASEHAFAPLGNTPLLILAAFLAADLSYYWEHRCAHKIEPLWRLYHAIHHSSRSFTVATAYRVSFLTQLLAPAFYLPWILLGFDPLLIAGFQLLAFHYQAWVHTEMVGRLPLADPWLNTPANHRMHHSRAAAHRDRNFGAVLIVWDRLFGSYAAPEDRVEYGIPGELPPSTVLGLYTRPWRGARARAGVSRSALASGGPDELRHRAKPAP